jgi:uridine kinase
LSLIDGVYSSGKTTICVNLINAFLQTANNIKTQRELEKQNKKTKTYSIKELMACDSSDDEGYSEKQTKKAFFPWY